MLSKLIRRDTYKPFYGLIVAHDRRFGIARYGYIPWHIAGDYHYFQDVTTKKTSKQDDQNAIIMGKNTWYALPPTHRSLPDRINIVLAPDISYSCIHKDNMTHTETYVMNSLESALKFCQQNKIPKTFVCGGKQVYSDTLKKLRFDEIYLSEIDHDYDCEVNLDGQLIKNVISEYNFVRCKKMELYDKSIKQNVPVTFKKYAFHETRANEREQQYLNLMEKIIMFGERKQTRNAITYSKFGKVLEFDLSKGFPLLTTKQMFLRGIAEELFFFLRGETDSNILSSNGINIWKPNTSRKFLDSVNLCHYDEGDIGPMYGYQWRHFNSPYFGSKHNYSKTGYDQLKYCIDLIKNDPTSRRIIMTTYNPLQASQGVLFPCHGLTVMFTVENGNKLSCMMTQRSADYICGVPFNIASYALLIHLICEYINNDPTYTGQKLEVGRLIMNLGDVHIYDQHINIAKRQILREPFQFPKLSFNKKIISFEDLKYDDIKLENYVSYPKLRVNMIA
jgi:dihydrofolate reductase/thymidylate synthase